MGGRNRDAVRLAELKGIQYSRALSQIRDALAESDGETRHVVALRLIEAEEARLKAVPTKALDGVLFQEPVRPEDV
ncbi:hypothetical protein [Streptomyces sp. SID161]|uniref:hypothetical protein n=1 Tax=Streptomyces sp. SID161 TaxID=2690251 RepID=UPI00136B9E51|nr:hypothetical protein [Streptomyces sp. SID161]MYW49626.1 hypothetical protein [Streptomyces sp. SID161]